jgi:stage IV sporulation protein FB
MVRDIPLLSEWSRLDDTLRLLEQGVPAIAVTGRDGRIVGLVTWENLVERLMIDQAISHRVRVFDGSKAATARASRATWSPVAGR